MAALAVAIFFLAPTQLMLTGCRAQPELTPQEAEGQHLYAVRCAHCHEENDLGMKPPPPEIHGVLRRAKLPSGIAATDAEVRRQVIYGKGKMPSFSGRFTEEQMAALLKYLHTDMPMPTQSLADAPSRYTQVLWRPEKHSISRPSAAR